MSMGDIKNTDVPLVRGKILYLLSLNRIIFLIKFQEHTNKVWITEKTQLNIKTLKLKL